MRKISEHDQGNVILLGLLAMILFVALIYAVIHVNQPQKRTARQSTPSVAMWVTQYSAAMRTGVTRLLLRQMPMEEIDFTVFPGSDEVPLQKAAQMVFHPSGGGVNYTPVKPDAVVTVESDPATFTRRRSGNWHFPLVSVNRVGTVAPELLTILADVTRKTCLEINEQITGQKIIPQLEVTLPEVLTGKIPLSGEGIDGQSFLCIKTATDYLYYHVLAEQ